MMRPDGPDPATPSERRQHRRYPVMFSVTVESEGALQHLAGELLDVSDGGLLLALPQSLAVGTRVEVQLETPVMAFALPGRIVWTATLRGPSRPHGVAFDLEKGPPFAQRLYEIARQSW
ncbi:MAG: PilZ domain-containing protein [candidate division NC10 bacterium]|nr:PilZ domain-containing protein [candidate division NC10 bacterium]